VEAYATAAQVYAAGLVFARIGAMVMLVPGLGDASVPPRIRLSFALLMSFILTPLVAPGLTVPATMGAGAGALIRETLIGLMMGSILRLFLSSLATAGEVVSIRTTPNFAQAALTGRFGGRGFAMLRPGLNLQQARERAEQLRLAIRTIKRPDGQLTVSIGAAEYRQSGETVDALLARADQAMRQAKRSGRDRIVSAVGN